MKLEKYLCSHKAKKKNPKHSFTFKKMLNFKIKDTFLVFLSHRVSHHQYLVIPAVSFLVFDK